MNSIERKAHMERMADDFYYIVLELSEENHIALEKLYVQKGERSFRHALTKELNETQEFDGANYEIRELTVHKVKL